jgi:enamine deaminase RidA (YjgF/YER057c/UK114 family)
MAAPILWQTSTIGGGRPRRQTRQRRETTDGAAPRDRHEESTMKMPRPKGKRRITSEHVGEPPPGTWSNCLVVANQVFIAGMTARGNEFNDMKETGAYEQAVAILTKIKHLMEAAGGSIDDIVKVVIYLTDINDRDAVWKARREFFKEPFPVSTLFEVSKLVRPEMKVEIDAVAVLHASVT